VARTSNGPRFYKSKAGWFANFGGERIRLTNGPKSTTEKLAKERYAAEKAARQVEVAGDRNTVYAILVAYLENCANRVKTDSLTPNTHKLHNYVLKPFNATHGNMLVRDLRPQHVTDWLARMGQRRRDEKRNRLLGWGETMREIARNVLRTALIWAKDEAGLISSHPFDRSGGKVKRKKRKKRQPSASRAAVTDHEHALILEQAARRSHKGFFDLLRFLYATGARPAEMYGCRADEWDEKRGAFRIKAAVENHGRYKLAHLGADRFVYVPAELVPAANELMAKYPTGTLFRTERDGPWTEVLLCARMKSIKRAANRAAAKRNVEGVRKEVTAYSWRHAFVTRWIKAGKSLPVLCELLNTSEAMIRQHYSHLFEEVVTLRESLDQFISGAGASPTHAPSSVSTAA
jgi:integrase